MKSRLAILSMLVAGMLLSTTGAGLAVTGLSSNDASVAQYGTPTPTPTPNNGGNGGTLGEGSQGGPKPGHSSTPGTPGTQSGTPSNGTTTGSGVQPARQVEAGAGSGQLPFTGFLAIPVLLGGLALLTTGLVLRRRTANERE